VDPSRAPISAGKVLGRVCRHQGYLNCFVRDEEAQAADVEEPAMTHPRLSEKSDRLLSRSVPISGEFNLRSFCERLESSPISGGVEKTGVTVHATKQQGHA
jgi:hypothetical protein